MRHLLFLVLILFHNVLGRQFSISIPVDEIINQTLLPNATYELIVRNVNAATTFVTLQAHSYQNNIYGSTSRVASSDTSMTGSSIGLISFLNIYQYVVVWYLENRENSSIDVALIVMQYGDESLTPPIPGGCTLTSNLEIDPNIYVLRGNYFHTTTIFSQANAGVPRGATQFVCAMRDAPQFRLHYDLYIYYLPRYSKETSYIEGIEKMMTVDNIRKHGEKVSSYTNKFQAQAILASIIGQGVVYNVIVTDPLTNHSAAAYVPKVNFGCTYETKTENQANCNDILIPGYLTLYIILCIYGLFLCFFGHYFFKIEVFFFGALSLGIPSFLIFSTCATNITTGAVVLIGFVCGGIGGAALYMLWWLYGKVLPTMLLVALNLGYLVASCAFFIGPLGNLNVWRDDAAYGLTFSSAILLMPIFLIPFMRKLSVLASAVWGSYLMMSLVSYVSKGSLHLIILYPLARTVYNDFNKNLIFLPYATEDIVIFTLWVVLIVAGVTTQHILTRKDQRDFPECPSHLYAKNNVFLNREQQTPPVVDSDERAPLLQNTANSINKYV